MSDVTPIIAHLDSRAAHSKYFEVSASTLIVQCTRTPARQAAGKAANLAAEVAALRDARAALEASSGELQARLRDATSEAASLGAKAAELEAALAVCRRDLSSAQPAVPGPELSQAEGERADGRVAELQREVMKFGVFS
jgi:hypothetical protein